MVCTAWSPSTKASRVATTHPSARNPGRRTRA
jgi:hypothetical protein